MKRVFARRKVVKEEAFRARKFSKEKLFLDAIDFVEEGLEIARKRKTMDKGDIDDHFHVR